jgi:IS5 family transposase
LAATVNRAVQRVLADLDGVRKSRRAGLARLCQNLLRVVGEDLEANAEGRLQVAYRTSAQRLISHGDPEAQHFRKSRSKVCSGYKLHALADAVSGLVLALLVTPGGEHDSTQLVPLLVHAKSLHEQIDEVLADAAYGGMATRNEALAVTGTRVLAPPLTVAKKEVGLGKGDVSIDFDKRQAICPGGVMTRTWKPCLVDGAQSIAFVWPPGSEEHCTCRDVCPVHKPRTRKDGKPGAPFRRLLLHADEQGLREVRAEWARPETRARYRRRSMWERLMRELTRRGARRAGAWGLGKATLQAHLAAGISNLLILAKRLSEKRRSARLAS